ncbi:hypothetical protein M8J77_009951 [Diaphorina citri]|nr:hypothetical protein M8J77_009951 [Diaphorina citri]
MNSLDLTILLLISTTYAAPLGGKSSQKRKYSVTVLNDSSVGDFIGTVHTWLAIRSPDKETTYFSFSHVKGATWKVVPGESSVDKHLKNRSPTERFTMTITPVQYDQMIQAIDDFYKTKPKYSLFPQDDNSYNCVTASNKILNAANIHILDGYMDPVMLGIRLSSISSILNKCIFRPNIFMLFGFTFHKAFCLFL